MILKFGTLNGLAQHKSEMPEEVFCHLHSSIRILDENYGANRNIDLDDGGFALLFETEDDFTQICRLGTIDFTYHVPEWVDCIKTKSRDYAAALYLTSNDFGIILVAPVEILSLLPDVQESLKDS